MLKKVARVFNPRIKQGVSYRLVLKPRQPNGEPFNWAGYQFFSQIRLRPDAEEVAAEFNFVPDFPNAGDVSMQLTAMQTGRMQPGEYAGFDAIMVDPEGNPYSLIEEGKPVVTPGTTRIPGVNVDA